MYRADILHHAHISLNDMTLPGLDISSKEDGASTPIHSQLASALAFGNHGVRLGLEISLTVLLYTVFTLVISWNILELPVSYHSLASWFLSCGIVIIIDHFLFFRPVSYLRMSYHLDYGGKYQDALREIEKIAPHSSRLVRCPKVLYHARRAEILAHAGQSLEARRELEYAKSTGLELHSYYLLLSEILRNADLAQAKTELEIASSLFSASPTLELEKAFIALHERNDWRKTKKGFEQVMAMPEDIHRSGETTRRLARAFHQVTRLWTGEAEEGLEKLNFAIAELRSAVGLVETLRPLVSMLVLERAYYFATHRQPQHAAIDLRVGLALCNLPPQNNLAQLTAEELRSRYDYQAKLD